MHLRRSALRVRRDVSTAGGRSTRARIGLLQGGDQLGARPSGAQPWVVPHTRSNCGWAAPWHDAQLPPKRLTTLAPPRRQDLRTGLRHVEREELPVVRRGTEPGAALDHRLLRDELDDRADRIRAAGGRSRDRERRGEMAAHVADEVVVDARHRVDVREVGRGELRRPRPARVVESTARARPRAARRSRRTRRTAAPRSDDCAPPHPAVPAHRRCIRIAPAAGSRAVEPVPLPGRDRLERRRELDAVRVTSGASDAPRRPSGASSSQATVMRRSSSANDHAPATPGAAHHASSIGARRRALLHDHVHAAVRPVRHRFGRDEDARRDAAADERGTDPRAARAGGGGSGRPRADRARAA